MKQTLILLLTLALFVAAVAMQAQTSSDDAAPGALHGLLIDVTGREIPDAVITIAGTSMTIACTDGSRSKPTSTVRTTWRSCGR